MEFFRNDSAASLAFKGSEPIISALGDKARAAIRDPDKSPPPPQGANTASTLPISLIESKTTVP